MKTKTTARKSNLPSSRCPAGAQPGRAELQAPVTDLPSELQDLKYAGYQNGPPARRPHAPGATRARRSAPGLLPPRMACTSTRPWSSTRSTSTATRAPFAFNADDFDYGQLRSTPTAHEGLGAGFKILYPVNTAIKPNDELRLLPGRELLPHRRDGQGQGYGLSARGLAIDTALPSGEEFPALP